MRKHTISFKNALNGIFYAFTSQPNFKIHGMLAFLALLAGFLLKISFLEMTILVLAIVIGLAAEMINTSIESMTDLITNEWRQEAKIAKDVAAGMMFLTAAGTVIVGALILGPYLVSYLITGK